MMLFKPKTKNQVADSLASFMPTGRIFQGAYGSGTTLRNYILGLGIELFRVNEKMNLISADYDINATIEFIGEWESAVGIPDDCFDGAGTLEVRRKAVLSKLAKLNITTIQDFIDLATLFGASVTITQGVIVGLFPMQFPLILFSSMQEARFTMVVTFATTIEVFPLDFSIPFGNPISSLIECLFNRLRPSNVQVIYR